MENLNEYNIVGTDLRKMQLRMFEMLEFLDYICQKHNIPYWLSAGTLLGAVRHGGFIPWDDDLDIEMQKDDYKRLLKVLKTEMSDKYVLQTHQSDRNYIFPIAKLRDKNSYISELYNADKNYKYRGIYIDIFYLDNGNHFFGRLAVNLQKFVYVLTLVKNDKFGLFLSLKIIIFGLLNNLVFPLILFLICLFNIKTKILALGTGFTKLININNIFPLQKILFEGKYFNAPANIDAYLKDMYGDYMKVPNLEKRQVHTIKCKVF